MDDVAVKPGDVLLFHGRGFVSWAIRKFDGTDVNHAAISLGDGKLGEAAGRGLQTADLSEAFQKNDFTIIKRLEGKSLDEVVGIANGYIEMHRPYAYQQIVLLAILASTRQIPLPAIGRRFIRSALDHAAAALNAFLDRDGNRSMICSEFVYRCYEEAPGGPPPPYHLGVVLGDMAFDVDNNSVVSWALEQPDETLPEVLPASFGIGAHVELQDYDAIAEVELAPLIAAYADETGLADPDMPDGAGTLAFDVPSDVDVSDQELLGSLVTFGGALSNARDGSSETFALGSVIGSAAAKGAIEGIRHVSVEPNFVTPGDLLRSPSLAEIGRVRPD
jgi:hypothetical protein